MSRFADPNLQLLLLQAAWDQELIPPFDKAAFFRDVLKEESDTEADYNYKLDRRVLDALLAIPLGADVLSQIRSVEWDGGNPIFLEIWSCWDGESDEFDVHDLTGINECTALEEISFIAGARFSDVSAISGMPSLAKFFNHSNPVDDLKPFLTLPRLTRLQVRYPDTDANKSIVTELNRRGVTVTSD